MPLPARTWPSAELPTTLYISPTVSTEPASSYFAFRTRVRIPERTLYLRFPRPGKYLAALPKVGGRNRFLPHSLHARRCAVTAAVSVVKQATVGAFAKISKRDY